MVKGILLDTNILIDYMRGYEKAVSYVSEHMDNILLSTIVVGELYAGIKGKEEAEKLERIFAYCRIIPVTYDVAKKGGLYKRDYFKSHGMSLADAIIAATAKKESATLATLNVKHFPMFNKLKTPYKR